MATAAEPKRRSGAGLIQRYALVLAFILVLVVFSILKPGSFLSIWNVKSLLTAQSVTMLLGLAVMVPLATNQFDMSVGYHAGLAQVLVIGLQENYHLSWLIVIPLIIVIGALVGTINGILITRFGVSAFIATLGSGMVLYGFTNWFTGGQQIVGAHLPPEFLALSGSIGPVPIPVIIVALVAIGLYIFLEHTVPGRGLFVVGSSPRAAELSGISSARSILGAFIISGVLAAVAGIILGCNLRTGTAAAGPEYLMPAFASAMLGATAIKSGQFNVIGTLIAALTLAFLFSGVQQLGAPFFAEYFFNGGILVLAVALSAYAARLRRN